MADQGVMDVVNAALAGSTSEPVELLDTEASSVDDSAGAGEVADGDDTEGAVKPEGEEGAEAEGDETAEGVAEEEPDLAVEAELLGVSKRNADGTFKSKEKFAADVAAAKAAEANGGKPALKGAAKTPEQQAAEAAAKGKKEPDPINDPIPKGVAVETQQRIRTLIDRTKASEEKAAEVQQNFDYLVQGVQATGATPQQYGETLSWLSLFNSNDPAQQTKALEIIEDLADRLATMVGVERKISDPMAAHPDLQAAVKAGNITVQYAKEMARQRNQGAFQKQLSAAASTQQQQEQAAAQEKEQARVDLNSLEETLLSSDPQYDAKKAAILPTLKVMFPKLPPAQWKDTFIQLYRSARVAAPVRRVAPVVAQPMRANKSGVGTGGTGAPAAQPKSAMDVMNAALANVGK